MKTVTIIIDDIRTPTHEFTHQGELIICRTHTEALNFLTTQSAHIACLYLDHDLGEYDDTTQTIMPIIDHLCEQAYHGNPYPIDQIVVHSANPVGVGRMKQSLETYTDYPVTVVSSDDIKLVG